MDNYVCVSNSVLSVVPAVAACAWKKVGASHKV